MASLPRSSLKIQDPALRQIKNMNELTTLALGPNSGSLGGYRLILGGPWCAEKQIPTRQAFHDPEKGTVTFGSSALR